MFTGIIEEVGRVLAFEERRGQRRLTIESNRLVRELVRGSSIAVSGVCLTAVEIEASRFSADLAAETVRRTSLSQLKSGALVNLELPAHAGDRLGGHIVQGHVDGVATLESLESKGSGGDYWLVARIPADLARYVVEKGSISLEGISLTVAGITGDEVSIAIIPHTRAATNLKNARAGDLLNVEVDVLAKYAEKLGTHPPQQTSTELTMDDLLAKGF